ncbi:MAG: DUF2184 domain-containing protein [Lachnospiraceae bacterium]|nr:DUF2184 domain-containing protein [Lachnospiraceae bacterium]
MKQYNMDDYRALKGSTLMKGMAGSGSTMRFDSVEQASVFFARELDQVKSKTYDKVYPELSALANFPITSDVNEGAETTTYYSYDIAGMAEIINNYATDLPRVDVKGESHTAHIKSIGDSYGYNVQEMRASRLAGKSLDARKGAAARRASDYMVNKIAWAGDAKHDLIGIFSENNDIPLYTLSEVTVDGKKYTDWAHKSADQILEDINGMQKFVDKITMGIEKPDTLALPSYIFMDLSTRRIPDTETTVLSFIKEHAPYLKNFESCAELQASATDINTSGKDIAFMYTKDPEKFSLEIPLPFYQYPIQIKNLETEVPCEQRTAGLIIYYPLSMLLAYGI